MRLPSSRPGQPAAAHCAVRPCGTGHGIEENDGAGADHEKWVVQINMLNEKIFIFLWWWFLVVLVVTALSIVHWLAFIIFPASQVRSLAPGTEGGRDLLGSRTPSCGKC